MTRSRIIGWLKLLLPLIALALLSTMFLFSARPTGKSSIPFSEYDLARQKNQPSIIAPEFATVTNDGTELTLQAGDIGQIMGPGGAVSGLRLDMHRKDGLSVQMTAPDAVILDDNVTLSGGVTLDMSSGWQVKTDRIDVATDRSRLKAQGGIKAMAPFGEVSSDRLELSDPPAEDAAILSFTGRVRLIYQP